jgi:G3E family GTPase
MEIENKKINVILISGFLGAGKTTLLNKLLKQFTGEKNIVIENEFGKVNIDAQLIDKKFETVFELTNGCICCSLDEELYDVLGEIAQKKEEVDNLFIETTGIADPGSIATIFKVDQVAEIFDLKKIVCVIDAETLEDHMMDTIEPHRQLVASDIILINKTPLVSTTYLTELEQNLSAVNPFATIIKTADGFLDRIELFKPILVKKEVFTKEINKENPHKINNVLFESDDLLDFQALYHTLNTTLFLYYSQLFRIKGFVRCFNSNKNNIGIYEVQSTGKTLTISTIEKPDFEKNQLVVIGRQLKTETILRIMRGAVAKEGIITSLDKKLQTI